MTQINDALNRLQEYFKSLTEKDATNAERVGWNSPAAQQIRFAQLLKIIPDPQESFSLIDFGCGLGDLSAYLREQAYNARYTGYDMTPESVAQAKILYPDQVFTHNLADLESVDYVIGSGLFGLKLDNSNDVWEQQMKSTLRQMWSLTNKGMAFNSLTTYSDPPYMRPELYYAQPEEYFAFCKIQFSRQVALLHDYDLYDFTIHVRAMV